MQANQDMVSGLSAALTSTVSPDASTRRAAEEQLRSAESQPGFLLFILELVKSDQVDAVVRQAAALYFKNAVKKLWEPEETEQTISEEDKNAVKTQLVPIMIGLGTPATARLQAQIGEGLATIASTDFPAKWQGLVDELVNSLTPDNFVINNGVLAAAHSIFKRWRAMFRSDDLYTEINYVLDRFCNPYLGLFRHVDERLTNPTPNPPANATPALLAQCLLLLIQLYHDLNVQEFPPFFEQHLSEFMGDKASGKEGWLRKYLSWETPELKGDDDDEAPGVLQKIRASICEIAELYALRYLEFFDQLELFVEGVWSLLTVIGPGTREDILVSKALRFMSVVVKLGKGREMVSNEDTLRLFCQKIILPNMTLRQHEEEMFEDDPAEYIRRDLEPSTDTDTRRQAATVFTQALMSNFEAQVTTIIQEYITSFLQDYASNPSEKWKSKDTAIYLLTSIASRGSTQQLGVTSTNVLVDVVTFFGQNVISDLQAAPGTVHPILTVDAIKFLYTFRNQLTKDQLVSVLPLLVQHLATDNYVIYSYAAITIERILFIKQDKKALFVQADVRPFAENILMALFAGIEKGQTPEKTAENDYLMKCAMRVIIVARQSLTPHYEAILNRLIAILGEISKNPSNPRFNQFCFESVSALIRFVCEGTPSALPTFEQAIFGPAQVILAQDISEFIPYIFQILSQLLELHAPNDLPNEYQALLSPLLGASLWEQRGNVPALVRIWKALILRGGPTIAQNGQVQGLLGIFQRLIGSKVNDIYGFELVQSLYEFMPLEVMQPHTQAVFMLLLNRLSAKPSTQFTQAFVYFSMFICCLDNVGPDFLISALEAVQQGLFNNLFGQVILTNTQKTPPRNRKVVSVGLTKMLSRSDTILRTDLQGSWQAAFLALLDLFTLPQDLTYDEIDELDPEETGFQSSFSKLGASEQKVHDPVADVPDEKLFASRELAKRSRQPQGTAVAGLIQSAKNSEQGVVDGFTAYMQSNGHMPVAALCQKIRGADKGTYAVKSGGSM